MTGETVWRRAFNDDENCDPIVGWFSEAKSKASIVRERASLDGDALSMLGGVVALQESRLNLSGGSYCILVAVVDVSTLRVGVSVTRSYLSRWLLSKQTEIRVDGGMFVRQLLRFLPFLFVRGSALNRRGRDKNSVASWYCRAWAKRDARKELLML